MGINGPQATACYGGLGTFVSRGENRVNDLECHANCLRERLDRLEAMLPTALIEAGIAIQKGERPRDLLQLAQDDEPAKEEKACTKGTQEISAELSCIEPGSGQDVVAPNIIEDDDEPRVCMLQLLARKEKRLRKKIYEMEMKEERYKKALAEAGKTLQDAKTETKKKPLACQPRCPGTKNQTMITHRKACTSSKDPYGEPVKQRIEKLETSSKNIDLNLKSLHRERAQLTCQAKKLTEVLRCTQKCLGQVQQRVLGRTPSQVIPVMKEASLDDAYEKTKACCGNSVRKLPRDPEALRTLAGQFKEAYKKAEDQELSPSVREPIRKTAERLRALSNLDPNGCSCGQSMKCDSCVICSCAEWERDLEGGGDESLEECSSDSAHCQKGKSHRPRKERTNCHCGCNETSSESECPCGCSNLPTETAELCSCSCGLVMESSAESTYEPSTITETTIPSSDTDDSGYNQVEPVDVYYHGSNFSSCESSCTFRRDSSPQTIERNRAGAIDADQSQICECTAPNESPNAGLQLREVCPCACTMCATLESKTKVPTCEMNKTVLVELNPPLDDTPVECTCSHSSDLPADIQKVRKVEKLRESVENLKNRNHAMRHVLKSRGCLSDVEDSKLAPSPQDNETHYQCPGIQSHVKQTTSSLMCTVRLLQSKCRTKDGMIVALADELKKALTPEQTSRILKCLADPKLCRGVSDFDRSELWNYLKTSSDRKQRVSAGLKTCHRDLLIGLIVLFLITVSHVARSYSIMPPCSEIVASLKYWMDEIPGNLAYLTNVLANFARVLLQKQCFVSFLKLLSPLTANLRSVSTLLCSLPGVHTGLMLVKITTEHLESICSSVTTLARSLRHFRLQICTQLCRILEYLNMIKRFILFQKMHLPSLRTALKNSVTLLTSYFPTTQYPTYFREISFITDLLPPNIASCVVSFVKIVISHVLCLWAFIVASPAHLRGVSSLLLYLFSCMISAPAFVQNTLERAFEYLFQLPSRYGLFDPVLNYISKIVNNMSSLIESCCCSGSSHTCASTGNSKISFESINNTDDHIGKSCASVLKDKNCSIADLLLPPSYGDDLSLKPDELDFPVPWDASRN